MLEIAALRITKPYEAVVRFAGIDNRNVAENIKGTQLYVPREALPAPEPGAFYHADLVGLGVEDGSGNRLGTVHAVHNFGAGDVLEIAFAEGGSEFFPFTDAVVPVVDIAAGRIVIAVPHDADD
jgi:16S rRNA processing protein RimM